MSNPKKSASKYEVDMCHGPLLGKIIVFAIPLILSGILQLLFNAADIVVVGRFAGSRALAAVGSTSALSNLLVNVFMGLSIGANVLVARFYGAEQIKDVEETVHTAMLTALISGLLLMIVGAGLSRPLLTLMGTPGDVIDYAALYMRIYFVGIPVMLLYNFGAAILRAVGDTKRPLYYLLAAGIVNVILNLIFVIRFSMGVAGVACATVISQTISAGLILLCLFRSDSSYCLRIKKLKIVPQKLKAIFRIGLPAGVQGALFSISNVVIQSSVNSFGSIVMAGNTAASNIGNFIYTSMNAVYQTALSFTSQNYGAGEYGRMRKIAYICMGMVTVVGLTIGMGAILNGPELLGIYSSDPQVIEYGLFRLRIIASTYFICGLVDVMVGVVRGMGYSVMPMLVSLTGICVFRIFWIMTAFRLYRSLTVLYCSYPLSWTITFIAHMTCYLIVRKKVEARGKERS